MTAWIISIVCIVLISSIFTLILPENRLTKYIKSIFGIVVVFVVIQPVFFVKNGDIDFNYQDNQSEIVFQKDYLYFIAEEKVNSFKVNSQKILESNGFKNNLVSIEYTVDENGQPQINQVTIDLKNSVCIYDSRHIDIIEDIILPVSEYLNLEEKQVNVIE